MAANAMALAMTFWLNRILPSETPCVSAPPDFRKVRRLLVVPSVFVGDNLLLTPFFRNLRQNFASDLLPPDLSIDVVLKPAMASLFEPMPYFNQQFTEGSTPGLLGPFDYRGFLEARHYDAIFLCHYNFLWGLAAQQAHIPIRIGFDFSRLGVERLQRWGRCLTHPVPSTPLSDDRPQLDVYLDLLRSTGLRLFSSHVDSLDGDADREKASQLLTPWRNSERPKVLLHLTAGSPGKEWALDYWQALIQEISHQYNPLWFATGTLPEAPIYECLSRDSGVPIQHFCGQLSIPQSISLLREMDLVITVDTAMAHMAAMAEVPQLIVLYGPTNIHQWHPPVTEKTDLQQVYIALPCRPCPTRSCLQKQCLQDLSVPQVIQAVEKALLLRFSFAR